MFRIKRLHEHLLQNNSFEVLVSALQLTADDSK